LQAGHDVAQRVAGYYDGRVREFGATPWGVDWTCEPTQQMRFVQLLKVAGQRRDFSLNDLGCGYGALLPFVRARIGAGVDYVGIDVAPAMIRKAVRVHGDEGRFLVSGTFPRIADFCVASGVFNVQLGFADATWRAFVREVLRELHRASRIGFAANFLLPPQRGLEPLPGLYRTRAGPWAAFCRRAFGADVAVVRGYGLREFTLLVRASRARRAASGRAPSSRTAP
jgi:SAM-dependent methyltransferase